LKAENKFLLGSLLPFCIAWASRNAVAYVMRDAS
jgi:hypothetical protein